MKTNTKGNLIIFRLALTAIMLVSAFALFPSETAEAAPKLLTVPSNLTASDGTYADGIHISWSYTPLSGEVVELWRNTSTTGTTCGGLTGWATMLRSAHGRWPAMSLMSMVIEKL